MEKTIIQEATDILKNLSPKNQAYFITLARVAETAENGVRDVEKNSSKPKKNLK